MSAPPLEEALSGQAWSPPQTNDRVQGRRLSIILRRYRPFSLRTNTMKLRLEASPRWSAVISGFSAETLRLKSNTIIDRWDLLFRYISFNWNPSFKDIDIGVLREAVWNVNRGRLVSQKNKRTCGSIVEKYFIYRKNEKVQHRFQLRRRTRPHGKSKSIFT